MRRSVQDFADAARPNGGMTETAPSVGIRRRGPLRGQSVPIGWQIAFPVLQENCTGTTAIGG